MWLFGNEPNKSEQRTAIPTEANAHEAMLTLCASATTVVAINLPRSDEFVVNSRDQKLHVRTSWPAPSVDVRGIVVYCHGYGGHCSRPWVPFFCQQLNAKGLAFVGLDWHGFGYSEGVAKALVGSVDDFIDDVMSLLSALYMKNSSSGRLNRTATANTPFFLTGFSMGGPAVVVTAEHIMRSEPGLVPLFKGCVFIAPAFEVKRPSAMTSMLLQNLVVPCFASTPIPAGISVPPVHANSWKHEGTLRAHLCTWCAFVATVLSLELFVWGLMCLHWS